MEMSRKIIILLMGLRITTGLCAQSAPIISQIVWIGNDVTKDYVIQREIHHPIGVPLDSALAQEDRNRLDNLGIFSEVMWQVVPQPDGTETLQYLVVESWRYMPGLAPVYEEAFGWSLSGGLIVNNFRGRNETLLVGGSIGANNTFSVNYSNPWLTGDHLSLDLEIGSKRVSHLFLPYNEESWFLGGKWGRYSGYTHKFKMAAEVYQSQYLSNVSPDIHYTLLELQGSYGYDTRDIYLEPTQGVYLHTTLGSRIIKNHPPQWIWEQFFSVFHQLAGTEKRPLVLAGNVDWNGIMGFKEAVWLNYLGGSYTVRGFAIPDARLYQSGLHPERFGYVQMYGSMELRKVVIPRHATSTRNEFGLTIVLFADEGITGDDLDTLTDGTLLFAAGGGIRIPFPILQEVCLEMGWGNKSGIWTRPNYFFRFGPKF